MVYSEKVCLNIFPNLPTETDLLRPEKSLTFTKSGSMCQDLAHFLALKKTLSKFESLIVLPTRLLTRPRPHPWEHLMIVYYDLLMVDNESLLAVKHSERFQALQKLITVVPGQSALVKRQTIDCTRQSATSDLRRAFAKCITGRGEGLVLKPDDPYFDFSTTRRPYSGCVIKLKKEYIGHFGDIGDFALVGARFDAAKARTYNISRLKWTHFYVGCLENKDDVQRLGKRPQFVVTNVVELNETQLEAFTSSVNSHAVRPEDNTAISLRIEPGVDNGKRPAVVFPDPPVVDLRCFSFDKEGNTGFWSPRFPSITKFHWDRTYHDAISFSELQDMAIKEKEMPPPEDSQELLGWIAALEKSEPALIDAASQSPVSTITAPMSPSARSSQPLSLISSGPIRPTDKKTGTEACPTGPVNDQITSPSRTSATRDPEPSPSGPVGTQEEVVRGQKRSREPATQNNPQEPNKIRKRSWDHFDPIARFHQNGRRSTYQESASTKVPAAMQRRNTDSDSPLPVLPTSVSLYLPDLEKKQADHDTRSISASASASFHEQLPTKPGGPPLSAAIDGEAPSHGDTGVQPSEKRATIAAGKCVYLPESCKLASFSILLSPCIANFPWVTEDLLSCHGVTDLIRDPKAWQIAPESTARLPSNTPGSTSNTSATGKTRRRRKIVLVDARRREATEAFLQSIEAAQLKRRSGEREYVAVYDWRVLESLKDEERKCSLSGQRAGSRFDLTNSQSIWRWFWLGLV